MTILRHTRGPWRWWTSNSLLRLSSDETGKDGDVLSAVRLRDGMADIEFSNRHDLFLIEAAPGTLGALIAAREELNAIYTAFGKTIMTDRLMPLIDAAIAHARNGRS